MALTTAQVAARDGKLTASRVACLMEGDNEAILNLWREMVGDNEYVPPSLEDVWYVQLGAATETVNLDWVQREHGPITARGMVFQHPEVEWAASTLDGWMEQRACPVEAKHNNGFEDIDKVIQRYMPQTHWQMFCTDAEECALSVIRGTRAPQVFFIQRDFNYEDELVKRATSFMEHVRNLTPPVVLEEVVAPKVEAVRRVDMAANSKWQASAGDWLRLKQDAASFEKAKDLLKKLVDKDVKEAFGHGVRIVRASNGSLTVREDKGND